MHRLLEIDRVQDFDFVPGIREHLSAFNDDRTFGLHFVKIKNQDAAANLKITSFRFFLNDFPHLSIQCVL